MSELPGILHQSADFLVLDKPAGWLSIPAREPKPTDRVVSHWVTEITGLQSFVLHRLDRFTSGVMIFALHAEAHRIGNSWFREKKAKKVYQFLASPPPSKPAIQVRVPVGGKPAQTLFEVIEKTEAAFFGRATPLTGRFHQIREHASEAGFPLVGDRTFKGLPAPRVCLHAYLLETPAGSFTAPFPEDLKTLWSTMKHDS